MSQITVSSSYYTLCDGSNGACGDCNNNYMQAAWANLSGFGNLEPYNCTCNGFNGRNLPAFSCNQRVSVKDICNGTIADVTITDHDSPGGCYCDHDCNGYYAVLRAMDMTEAAFAYFQSLTVGLIGVTVTYY